MLELLRQLKRLLCPGPATEEVPADPEKLRSTFRARYHNFKLLLSANTKALETMTGIERALRGDRPFGMPFVKAACTASSVNVLKMVRSLCELAPGKYEELNGRLRCIQEELAAGLSQRRPPAGERLVLSLGEVAPAMADQVGAKMAGLAELHNELKLRVPDGFVVTARGYERFMESGDLQAEIDRRIQSFNGEDIGDLYALTSDLQGLIIRTPVPDDLQQAVLGAYAELERAAGRGVAVSMRSSALGEDEAGVSFAGQYRSELNVGADRLLEAYKEIVASKYSLHAMSYRLHRGIPDESVAMCVGCVAMVCATAGGVMYSRSPVDPADDSVVITSAWGLPLSVVDGSVKPDQFVVSRAHPIRLLEKTVQTKTVSMVCGPEEGVLRRELPDDLASQASLGDEDVLELTGLALELERHRGCPVDVEWVRAPDGSLFILQCRPLHRLDADAGGFGEPPVRAAGAVVVVAGGVTASPGVACGPVFIVRNNADVLQFPRGSVLAASQPLPRWASLMGRAAAVVTEQGGVTGHLASVAREFGVPAVFGVPDALRMLETGRTITVDADARAVYEGRVEPPVTRVRARRNLMEGSPTYEALKRVSRSIVPLNLLDPESPEFRPDRCRTLHDLTRFCHEKSVREMFHFGKEHRFSERSSKQLVTDVPMQLWVINLDDGFREEVEGRFVQLGNIVCVPMLAIWEGMKAIPWEGPPPIDARGLMSVMFEATVDPALDPSMESAYSNRNYFLISRNFCNLQSRFGFHFCSIETLVGERPTENYISFQFKGGAADFTRRLSRVKFVAELLSRLEFLVSVEEDALFGRVEGRDELVMTAKLKALGYLIMHTRQLDMVMSNEPSIRGYRAKMLEDLRTLVGLE